MTGSQYWCNRRFKDHQQNMQKTRGVVKVGKGGFKSACKKKQNNENCQRIEFTVFYAPPVSLSNRSSSCVIACCSCARFSSSVPPDCEFNVMFYYIEEA